MYVWLCFCKSFDKWCDAMAWIWELTNESREWWCNQTLVNLNLYGERRVNSCVYTCIPLSLPIHQHPCIQQRLLGFAAQSTDRLGARGLHWRYIHWNGEWCEPLFNPIHIVYYWPLASSACILYAQCVQMCLYTCKEHVDSNIPMVIVPYNR